MPAGVARERRHVLLLGLDGSGKTRLAQALAAPLSAQVAAAPTMPSHVVVEDAPLPYTLHVVSDALLIARRYDQIPDTMEGKVPPQTIAELIDASGAASHRVLWPSLIAGTASEDAGKGEWAPQPRGIIFVIGAHDPLRLQLAWTELLSVAHAAKLQADAPGAFAREHAFPGAAPDARLPAPREVPILIAVVRTAVDDEVCAMSAADVLRACEHFAPIAAPISVVDVDLRPAPSAGADATQSPRPSARGEKRSAQPYHGMADVVRCAQWVRSLM